MSEKNEISRFIAECAQRGINDPEQLKDAALEKIQEIDAILAEADKLRPKRALMESVIKSFGFDAPKRAKRPAPIIAEESSIEDLDPVLLGYAVQVCRYLETHADASNRELMQFCEISPDNHAEIFSVIKFLCGSGICFKNETDRRLTRGPNWNSRPKKD